MSVQTDLLDEAREVAAKYDALAAGIRGNGKLSPEGKSEQLQANEARRRDAVAALRADAVRRIAAERSARTAELAKLRERAVAERRALLGDAEYARLLTAELSIMRAADIQRRFETAQPGWERELVRGYGAVELWRRVGEGAPAPDQYAALAALSAPANDREAVLEAEIRRLDDFHVGDVDRDAAAADLATRFGVRVEHVRQVDFGGDPA